MLAMQHPGIDESGLIPYATIATRAVAAR